MFRKQDLINNLLQDLINNMLDAIEAQENIMKQVNHILYGDKLL